ncbi:uncharacterized protein LOC114334213 [Diabrotica virgifera virgifera]|uniref:Uncharacterized protein LOC114334213 n=1 Tax=Diabrotica virgifera virgifera TaxID=50390 RepID=A0A6P7FUD0_DIAVI|nr:uncharacterized protein LOC114334213 [Diabrotica virgifera virgifera]
MSTGPTPIILQSVNGREFSNIIIEELCSMWKDLKIVHGKPRNSQSQGSVANKDTENILVQRKVHSWKTIKQTSGQLSRGSSICTIHQELSLPFWHQVQCFKNTSTEEDLEVEEQIEETQSGPDSGEREEAEVDEPNELLIEQKPEKPEHPSVNESNAILKELFSNQISEKRNCVAIKRTRAKEGLDKNTKKMP